MHPSLGTAAKRSERDDLTFDMMRAAFAAFAAEVRRYDPHRLVITGDSFLRPSAWHQEHEGSWKKDSPEQFAEMLRKVNPDPIDAISVHVYDHDDQRLAMAMAVSRQINKPLFVGEFGVPGNSPEQTAKFRRLLQSIVEHDIPLAALWVFDLSNQKDFNVTATNARSWQLDLIAETNKKLLKRTRAEAKSK